MGALTIWVLGVVTFWILVWKLTRKWQSLGLGLARALLRSLAVALAFAPTAISAGYVGFPFPASAALIAYAMDSHWGERAVKESVSVALHCFFVFWLLAFLIAIFRFAWVYDHRSSADKQR